MILIPECFFPWIDQVCEALVPPQNGSVYYDSEVYGLGTIATYNCSDGYFLAGTPKKQCMSDGRSLFWSHGVSNVTYCLRKRLFLYFDKNSHVLRKIFHKKNLFISFKVEG